MPRPFSPNCHVFTLLYLLLLDEIISTILREARKEALPYRRHSVEVLGKVVDSFQVDLFGQVYEMIQPLFQVKEEGEEAMEEDVEDKEQKEQQMLTLELHEAAIMALGRAFPFDPVSQGNRPTLLLLPVSYSSPRRFGLTQVKAGLCTWTYSKRPVPIRPGPSS